MSLFIYTHSLDYLSNLLNILMFNLNLFSFNIDLSESLILIGNEVHKLSKV